MFVLFSNYNIDCGSYWIWDIAQLNIFNAVSEMFMVFNVFTSIFAQSWIELFCRYLS